MPLLTRGIFTFGILAGILISSVAKGESLEDRVRQLEQHLNALRQTYRMNNSHVASAVARAEAVQRDALAFEGKIDANERRLQGAMKTMKQRYGDLDVRIAVLEERIGILLQQVTIILKKQDAKLANELDAYQETLKLLDDANYLEAIERFTRFVKNFPKSELLPFARFWIAESHFRMLDDKRAIQAYQRVVEKHPTHEKARKALLRQGECFVRLSLQDEAIAFYSKLVKEYPKSAEAKQAQEAIEVLKRPVTTEEALSSTKEDANSSYPTKTLQEMRKEPQRGEPQKDDSPRY